MAPALQGQEQGPGGLVDLELDEATRSELAADVRRARQQATQLRELPLDGVPPGFVWLAR